jgi:hypothetical protein
MDNAQNIILALMYHRHNLLDLIGILKIIQKLILEVVTCSKLWVTPKLQLKSGVICYCCSVTAHFELRPPKLL